jgi:ATP synthase protein I
MADPAPDLPDRADVQASSRRDIERLRRRGPETLFWRSLALIGSVGWPIVLLATGGALLGHYLDARWSTGVRFTLMLLSAGTALGSWLAYRALRGNGQ